MSWRPKENAKVIGLLRPESGREQNKILPKPEPIGGVRPRPMRRDAGPRKENVVLSGDARKSLEDQVRWTLFSRRPIGRRLSTG